MSRPTYGGKPHRFGTRDDGDGEVNRLNDYALEVDDRVTVSLVDGQPAIGGHIVAGLPLALVIQGADGEVTSIPWPAITAITRAARPPHPAT